MNRYYLTVRFHSTETDSFDSDNYFYWVDTNMVIKNGDYIILKDDVNWDALKVVKVISAELFEAGKKYEKAKTKALIGFAFVDDYFKAKEKKRRAKEIKAELEARFKEAEKMALYRKLAESDETMKSLLSELDALGVDTENDDEDKEEVTF
jgi:hypothetical protein